MRPSGLPKVMPVANRPARWLRYRDREAPRVDDHSEHEHPEPVGPGSSFPRRIALPHGGHVTIRSIRRDDVGALRELYDGLSPEDRERRFFSAYRPSTAILERWATVAERGGARLVAVLDSGRIVGEAGYELLDDGDGDLDITVAKEARGWVGPYLLDALIDLAAERGVPDLEADVLLGNRQMLALARSRGYVVLSHDEPGVVRLAMGTRNHPADWPGPRHGPRVLVESRAGRWTAEEVAHHAGMQAVVCPGPAIDACAACVRHAGNGCALVQGADVLVVVVPAGAVPDLDLIDAHRAVHPGLACFVQPVAGELPPDALAALPPEVGVLPAEPHDAVLALAAAIEHDVTLPHRDPST